MVGGGWGGGVGRGEEFVAPCPSLRAGGRGRVLRGREERVWPRARRESLAAAVVACAAAAVQAGGWAGLVRRGVWGRVRGGRPGGWPGPRLSRQRGSWPGRAEDSMGKKCDKYALYMLHIAYTLPNLCRICAEYAKNCKITRQICGTLKIRSAPNMRIVRKTCE